MSANRNGQESDRQRIVVGVLAAIALIGAVGGLWGWYSRANAPIPAATRKPSDFDVTWRCLSCAHETTAKAGRGPKPCPKCGKAELFVNIRWSCPVHGVQNVAYQYSEDGSPSKAKVGSAGWQPVETPDGQSNIRCPVCGGSMMPLG